MSGYLDVKYPFKSNLGLNPFKSWKRQWCIVRPSPTCSGAGSLAVYCSEAGATAGTVELPPGCIIRRTKSRTRPHAFAIFTVEEPRKPRILLAAPSLRDAQIWMDKIKAVLRGNKLLVSDADTLLKDTYSVTVVANELSRKCGLSGVDAVLTVTSQGVLVSHTHKLGTYIKWKHIDDILLIAENEQRTCVININSEYPSGSSVLKLSTPLASELVTALRQALSDNSPGRGRCSKKLYKSEGDLRWPKCSDSDLGEIRRSSWYSGPSDISLDDTDLVMLKDLNRIPSGQLSRCNGAGDLASGQSFASFDDSMSDRRSMLSLASGIYEEIPDLPETPNTSQDTYCAMSGTDTVDSVVVNVRGAGDVLGQVNVLGLEEPTYESVPDCVYATMRRSARRHPPPPLPPRLPFGTMKLGESWNSRMNQPSDGNVTRHSSLGSLPRCCSITSTTSNTYSKTKTLPKTDKPRQAFSVFRKRLKSDSRIATSPKSDTSKENKDVETKKKRFDFTSTRDVFKSFKVSRKMKNLKIAGSLTKANESKSCEFLDETEHVKTNRCSKSVECLEEKYLDDVDNVDLSIEFNDDAVMGLELPQEIVNIILRGRDINKVLKETRVECDYMPMSPIIPPTPIEHHYMVMSPRTNLI